MSWYCYVLRSLNDKYLNRTYTGATNDVERRIQQHNGILAGGAKSTIKIRPVEYFIIIDNLDKHTALSIEAKLHHMKRSKRKYKRKYLGLKGSMLSIDDLVKSNHINQNDITYM